VTLLVDESDDNAGAAVPEVIVAGDDTRKVDCAAPDDATVDDSRIDAVDTMLTVSMLSDDTGSAALDVLTMVGMTVVDVVVVAPDVERVVGVAVDNVVTQAV